MTPNKRPLAMTIHELIRELALVMEKAEPGEREQFKKSWLDSIPRFNAETKRIRRERSKNTSPK